ncbi:MAG: 50S ribosomal protein L23 [Acidimicrobiales bacterium]
MREPTQILIHPVVSEKTYALMERHTYVFVVDEAATKIDVRNAVEQAFNVKVTKVNTLRRRGKATRSLRTGVRGARPDTKRAIVTLRSGDSINLFES